MVEAIPDAVLVKAGEITARTAIPSVTMTAVKTTQSTVTAAVSSEKKLITVFFAINLTPEIVTEPILARYLFFRAQKRPENDFQI
ncbi:MAG: hypothetical protein L3J33_12020 [Rhodobacteraceae bacterium]|nr:hypothetical protein [Paracoccaceae bacterium]